MTIFKKLFVVNRLLFHTICLLIVSIIVTATLLIPSNTLRRESYHEESLYKTNLIDFDVPNTTDEQIDLLNNQQHIDEVIPYYLTSVNMNYNDEIINNVRLMMLDDFSQLEFTMYSEKRTILKSDITYSNPIFIDYEYAKNYNIYLGDVIKIPFEGTLVTFNVQAITERNTYYQGAFLALFIGEQKALINENRLNDLSYSGSFIVSNSSLSTRSFLDGVYAANNELTPQEIIKLADYSNEKFDKSLSLNNTANILFILSTVLIVVFGVSINLVLLLFFKETKTLKVLKKSGVSLFKYYIYVFIIEILIMTLSIYLITTMNQVNQTQYIPVSSYNLYNTILMFVILLVPLINLNINRFVYKRA